MATHCKHKTIMAELNKQDVFLTKKHQSKSLAKSPRPRPQDEIISEPKPDVFELFTIKTHSTPDRHSKSSVVNSELSDELSFPVSSPSKPSSKTYRDKINERFKNVKAKVGRSAKKASVYKETVDRLLLEKLRRETNEIDSELTNRRKNKTKTEDCEFVFWSDEQSELMHKSSENVTDKSTENLIDDQSTTELKPFIDVLGETRNAEREFLYVPKSHPVPLENKIEGEPKYLEEDGLYVPPEPKISRRSLNLLEQRLYHDGNRNWFNCEGKLNFVENPLLNTSHRLKQKPDSVSDFNRRFQSSSCEEIVVIKDNVLQFQIFNLKFTHHSLFSMEHVLEQKLRHIYNEYLQNNQNNTVERLAQRLKSLRAILKRSIDEDSANSDDEDDKIRVYRRDAKKLQEMVLEEGRKERDRIKSLLAVWKDIKKLRTKNKYSNTSIKLVIVKERRSFADERIEFDEAFEEFYEERIAESNSQNDDQRKELLEYYKSCVRPPGEPVLHFTITEDNEISLSVENPKEQQRRQAVASAKISLRIILEGIEVCKTKNVSLQPDFACNIDEAISIQLTDKPSFICVEIVEHPKILLKKVVSQLKVRLPPGNISHNNKKISEEFFVKDEHVEWKHEGVGSGISIGDSSELNTCGFLTCALYWDTPRSSEDTLHSNSETLLDEIVNKNGGVDLDKLSQWIDQSQPDPQDPKNSELFAYSLDSTLTSQHNYFRLDPFMDELRFCDPKMLEENVRLKILKLRNQNEPEFDGMVVPNRVKEIAMNALQEWKRRVDGESSDVLEDDDLEDEDIEKRRSRGRKYLKQVHIKIFQICKSTQNHLSYEDVVDEKLLHYLERYLRGLAQNFLNWFKIRPMAMPLPKFHKPVQSSEEYFRDMHYQPKIVVKITSAINIPQRARGEVSSFVEITVGEQKDRTCPVSGENPRWNHDLYFNLSSAHSDYLNPNSLSGVVIFDIFDEFEGETLEKFGGIAKKRFLGSLKIPLASICHDGIKGFFKVTNPDVLLGYKEPSQMPGNFVKETFLNLTIFVEPNVPVISPSIEELQCGEVPYIKDHALEWIEKYNSNFPHRKFSAFAMDSNATSRCIIRYIKPLEPPQINAEGFDVTPDQCVRYVSMIPFTESNQFYQNIWLTVDILIGSIVDHAVALTCYLLALKLDVWLVLGFGLPHGNTASVLLKEYDRNNMAVFSVYDVVRGEKIALSDPYCPLQHIYCLVNENNVWANIQKTDNLTLTRFDLNRRSDWLPLFTNHIPAPTNSAQCKIHYASVPDLSQMELLLDRKIRKRITKLRPLDVTTWTHQVSNSIKSVLSSLETAKMNKKNSDDVVTKVRRDILGQFHVNGFIMSEEFVSVSSILKRIPVFGVHLEEGSSVQFASAVYVKGYPGQVFSVLIFIASLRTLDENK